MDGGQPAANRTFQLDIGGEQVEATSDEHGVVEFDAGDSRQVKIDAGPGDSGSTTIDMRAGSEQVVPAGDGLFGRGVVNWLGWSGWTLEGQFGAGGSWQDSWSETNFPGFGAPAPRDRPIHGAELSYGGKFLTPLVFGRYVRPFAHFNYNQAVGDHTANVGPSGTPGVTGFTQGSAEYNGGIDLYFGVEIPVPLDAIGIPYTPYFEPFAGVGFDRFTYRYGINETQFAVPLMIQQEDYTDTRWIAGGEFSFPICGCGPLSTRLFTRVSYRGSGDTVICRAFGGPLGNSPATFEWKNEGVTKLQGGISVRISPLAWVGD